MEKVVLVRLVCFVILSFQLIALGEASGPDTDPDTDSDQDYQVEVEIRSISSIPKPMGEEFLPGWWLKLDLRVKNLGRAISSDDRVEVRVSYSSNTVHRSTYPSVPSDWYGVNKGREKISRVYRDGWEENASAAMFFHFAVTTDQDASLSVDLLINGEMVNTTQSRSIPVPRLGPTVVTLGAKEDLSWKPYAHEKFEFYFTLPGEKRFGIKTNEGTYHATFEAGKVIPITMRRDYEKALGVSVHVEKDDFHIPNSVSMTNDLNPTYQGYLQVIPTTDFEGEFSGRRDYFSLVDFKLQLRGKLNIKRYSEEGQLIGTYLAEESLTLTYDSFCKFDRGGAVSWIIHWVCQHSLLRDIDGKFTYVPVGGEPTRGVSIDVNSQYMKSPARLHESLRVCGKRVDLAPEGTFEDPEPDSGTDTSAP